MSTLSHKVDTNIDHVEDALDVSVVEAQYRDLVSSLRTLVDKEHPLLGNGERASKARSILIGRDSSELTSWKDFFIARLQFDIQKESITISLSNGTVNSKDLPQLVTSNTNGEPVLPVTLLQAIYIILKTYSDEDRLRFQVKGKMNDRAFNAMFGICKDVSQLANNNNLSSLKLDYHKIKLMIERSLKHARMQDVIKQKSASTRSDGRPIALYKFNEKIATKVFKFAKDKTQAYLPTVDISQYKDEFFARLQKDYSKTFVDGAEVANCTHKPIITRYPHHISRNGKSFDVIVINNALSPQTVKYLFEQFNNISFMSGKGKKEKCFVRVSSLTDSPFVMSNGETIYKSCTFQDVDYKLLSIFNNIKGSQEDAVLEARGGEEYKPTLICTDIYNITGHSKNCKFSHHSDYSTMHTSASANKCDRIYSGYENGYLPTQDEMQVVTLILSNSQQSESSRLVYKDKHKTGKLCKENIILGNNTIHIQGPGSQSNGITHQSEMIEGADSVPGTFRIIVTFRSSVPRNSPFFQDRFESHTGNPNAYRSVHWQYKYQHHNIIDKLVRAAQPRAVNFSYNKEHDDKSFVSEDNTTDEIADDNLLHELTINLSSNINKDTYTKICPNEYKKLNIVRPPPVGTFNATVFEVAKDPYFIQLLFRKGYLVRYVTYYNDDNTLSQSIAESSYFIERDAIPMVPPPPITPGVTTTNDKKKTFSILQTRPTLHNINGNANAFTSFH